MSIIELKVVVFLINLPFGYWRLSAPRFSRHWMMAVHIPVPFVFFFENIIRFWVERYTTMFSFAAGQFTGGKLRKFDTH